MRQSLCIKNLIALLICALLLAACGAVVTPVAYLVHKNKIQEPFLGQDPFIQEIAARFGFMAVLSEMVYYRAPFSHPTPCQRPADDPALMKLPSDTNLGKWERAANLPGVNFCLDDPSGVFYETFLFTSPNSNILEAVIVFRGTEGPSLRDWSANLSNVTGIEPLQYRRALQELEKLFEEFQKPQYEGLSIYAAGHSLGGGLAQQAGYRFSQIKAVYAFNSSPVTNWSWMALNNNEITQDWPVIYRLFHTGEALDPLRSAATAITTTRFNRYDIGIQLQEKSRIGGHAMDVIACGLAKIVAQSNGKENAHYYTASYAKRDVYDGSMCASFKTSETSTTDKP
ncbi:MAG: DUF6792 domain-containing protein [Paracoccaceae bacterium]